MRTSSRLTGSQGSVQLRCMKTIITITFGLLLAVSTATTVSAQVYSDSYMGGHHHTTTNCGGNITLYPLIGVSVGCNNYYNYQNNYRYQQPQTVYSYYYTSGCYTYYYDGVSRTSSISSYNCQTQPTYTYTQPVTYTYYTQPTTYTYTTYPSYYNSGYTNTGYYNNYNNGTYYGGSSCYYSNGYQICP